MVAMSEELRRVSRQAKNPPGDQPEMREYLQDEVGWANRGGLAGDMMALISVVEA